MKDEELLERSKKGDNIAFKCLIERFEQPIATVIKGILGDCPEAEDVGQEVFIKFYQSMHQFNGKSSLKTYITRIAINLSLNEYKKRKSNLSYNINEVPETKFINKFEENNFDEKEYVENALKQLPLEHRSIIVLRLMEGYSVKEASKMLKIPVGTVLSRLSRAQEKLRQILKPINKLTI